MSTTLLGTSTSITWTACQAGTRGWATGRARPFQVSSVTFMPSFRYLDHVSCAQLSSKPWHYVQTTRLGHASLLEGLQVHEHVPAPSQQRVGTGSAPTHWSPSAYVNWFTDLFMSAESTWQRAGSSRQTQATQCRYPPSRQHGTSSQPCSPTPGSSAWCARTRHLCQA